MNDIKSLQRGVFNSLRSSVVLFDLPRVVEELTTNSVDSGATKVYISINVRSCSVKVEDDGCGITRDGLAILGERYATSKIHLLSDKETDTESLGFRGEALASLSDVAIVEVRTKARRTPTAYWKILKGSKCLYFGIDDQREAFGTTVVVRDLFYNQPVRRNYMQSSPKRVLHSIKKCVLRIALVHPQVLFRVTDIASEDEVLSTVPSSSPLPLVSDGFGTEVSSSLKEVVLSDQVLMLSGYISGLSNIFSTKAFQYLYINSRFVCKGPIHNLINNLAASLHCSVGHRKIEPDIQSRKRHKTQGYPAFLLNLCCPLSSYDLHFEPSKTVVEFKDWSAVLSFFEKAIKKFWEQVSEEPLQGNNCAYDDYVAIESVIQEQDLFMGLSKSSKMKETECDKQLQQDTPFHGSVTTPMDISFEDIGVYRKKGKSCNQMHKFSWLKPCQAKDGNLGQAGCSSHHRMHDSSDGFASPHVQIDVDIYKKLSAISPVLENNLFSDDTTKFGDLIGLSDKNILEVSGRLEKGDGHALLDCDPLEFIESNKKIHFSVPCFTAHSKMEKDLFCSVGYEKSQSASYTNHNGLTVGFDHLMQFSSFQGSDVAADADKVGSVSHTHSHEKADTCRLPGSVTGKCQANPDWDVLSNGAVNSFPWEEGFFCGKNILRDGLVSDSLVTDSKSDFPGTDWHLHTPQSFTLRNFKTDTQRSNLGELSPFFMDADCRYSRLAKKDFKILNSVQNSMVEISPFKCSTSELDFQCDFSPERNKYYGSPSYQVCFGKVGSALCNGGTDWSPSESSNRTKTKKYGNYELKTSTQIADEENISLWDRMDLQNSQPSKVHKARSRRSCSAPPFYKEKNRFFALNEHSTMMAQKDSDLAYDTSCSLKDKSRLPFSPQPCLEPNFSGASQSLPRKCIDKDVSTHQFEGVQNTEECNEVSYGLSTLNNAAEGFVADELKFELASPTKWRCGVPQPTEHVSHTNMEDILSISSGILQLSASSLIPDSINKDCLDNARALLQVDRKFIPAMAGEILVIVDQHAADERIRLEELRQKVLSGEGTTVTYLDVEQELVLPEMGYQLLQKYRDQIQKWGWICNVHTQCSDSFAKNVNLLKRRKCGITLTAVPCILGINLDDKDLVEFIQQLVDTDGSSSIPPSVIRILNFKACRGAIMFGDALLPSECSLILEELKATSLCFQCAHGRPTTVPLVNLTSLREQLAILEMEKTGPEEAWHGLRHHVPTVERARLRLESVNKRIQGG